MLSFLKDINFLSDYIILFSVWLYYVWSNYKCKRFDKSTLLKCINRNNNDIQYWTIDEKTQNCIYFICFIWL